MKFRRCLLLPALLAAGCTMVQDDLYQDNGQVTRVYDSGYQYHRHHRYQRPPQPEYAGEAGRGRMHVDNEVHTRSYQPSNEVHVGGSREQTVHIQRPPAPVPAS